MATKSLIREALIWKRDADGFKCMFNDVINKVCDIHRRRDTQQSKCVTNKIYENEFNQRSMTLTHKVHNQSRGKIYEIKYNEK